MSWKPVADGPRTWSLVARLSAWFALSAFILLFVASAFLYWALATNLNNEDRESTIEELHVLALILRERPNDRKALEQEVLWEGRTRNFTEFYKRILRSDGSVLIETPGMAAELPVRAFPAGDSGPNYGAQLWSAPDGKVFRVAATTVRPGKDPQVLVVQAALDVSREQALLADYRRRLFLVLLIGVVAAATAGAFIAHRGIAPLTAVTLAAHRIGVNALNARLDPRGPREVTALAAAFNEMLARLEDAFARLNQFSADLAHELRTPINNLMGEAEVVLSRSRTADEYREALESALEEYARLSHIIDNLLFLARAERTDITIHRKPLDLRSEFDAVRDFYDAQAQESQVDVACMGEAHLDADPLLVRRALGNLLANALRHTPPGGRIDLSASSSREGVEIRVRDTGTGIDPVHLPHIFQRFYRADPARASGGTGLGLAIVKSIMELHGGQISVKSTPGAGSEFVLHFPAPARHISGNMTIS